jgi:hypothetical protein
MKEIEIAKKALDKAEEIIMLLSESLKIIAKIPTTVPRSIEVQLVEKAQEVAMEVGAYKELRSMLK